MRKMTFWTAAAVILGGWTHAAAADFGDLPLQGACYKGSQTFIRNNGGKGVRIKVQGNIERDEQLYSNLHPDIRGNLLDKRVTLGGLPPISLDNIGIGAAMVQRFGADSVPLLYQVAKDNGAWVTLAKTSGGYTVQIFVLLDPSGAEGCLTAYDRPQLLEADDVPAALFN